MSYFQRRFYRIIESIIRKILKFKNNLNNEKLQRSVRSAIYNTSSNKKILFSNYKNAKYLMPNNDGISKGIFIDNEWNFKVLDKALKLMGGKHSKNTLINVGAHIGSTCIPAIKKGYFSNAIAFEPSKINFGLLKANIYLNEIEDKVKIHNLALSDKKKKVFLKMFGTNTGDYRVLKKKTEKNSEIVFADILDNFTLKNNKKNSFIFMYAQGHEPEVFMGAKKTIRKKIPMVVEFIPYLFNKKWLTKLKHSFKYYNYFYDLKKNEKKKKFMPNEIIKLYDEYIVNNNYTDILIL